MKNFFFVPLRNNFWSFKKIEKKIFINEKKTCLFHQKSEGILHLLFAGNTLKFERLKISSEIKGNFKLDGNVLEIALQLYSALRFERLKRVQKSRAIPWEFWDEVFSLSMPSVCPHLTTVYLDKNQLVKIMKKSADYRG